jgi:hypothetical protein
MITDRLSQGFAALLSVLALAGCGRRTDARDKQRLQQEEQAENDEAKANQAITNMNQKMFGQMNSQPASSASNTAQPPPPSAPPPTDAQKP